MGGRGNRDKGEVKKKKVTDNRVKKSSRRNIDEKWPARRRR